MDDYHGTEVADSYRWLEESTSKPTREWVAAQNELARSILDALPQRERIFSRLEQLWDYTRQGVPIQRGEHYFFTRQQGLQGQPVLCVAESPEAEPRVLLDPNLLSDDGTVALTGYVPSPDGRLLAYGTSSAGSDWQTWRVRDVETAEDLDDTLQWVKFSSASWLADGSGFFYSRYDEPESGSELAAANYFQKLYLHRQGTPQSDDVLVYERPDEKEWGFDGEVTDDGRWLVISVWRGSERKNLVFYRDLSEPNAPAVELVSTFENRYILLGNRESTFWFRTDRDAPHGKIVRVELGLDDPIPVWEDVVPEADDVLRSAVLAGDRIIAEYLHDATSRLEMFSLAGTGVGAIDLPNLGTVSGLRGRLGEPEAFFAFTTFTQPTHIYRYDVSGDALELVHRPALAVDAEELTTRQVFYESRDGERIPMFLIGSDSGGTSGARPTYLYGYGGFDISQTPFFSPLHVVWLELGGLVAIPNIRGGGEYGQRWHEAGMLHRKQNVFDDFLAAAEWLIAEGHTTPEQLAISGRSNGGLLVGACLTQRPELFAAAVPVVGVLDMLRFHKYTIGWAWVGEYGSSDDAGQFRTLYRYSPLHNIRAGIPYPATLIVTGDHDDRVVPAHSYKFAAALQHAQSGGEPVLLRVETSAGHGAGKPTDKRIAEAADILAFIAQALGVTAP